MSDTARENSEMILVSPQVLEDLSSLREAHARLTEDVQLAVCALDDVGAPSGDAAGNGYSLNGRVQALVDRWTEELKVTDQLLANRQQVLDLFDCPAHGPCVPFAISEVQRLRALEGRLRAVEQALQADERDVVNAVRAALGKD